MNILNDKINQSGYKKKFIASKLNISIQALSKKLKGLYPFTVDEARILKELLNLTIEEAEKIFFK